MGHSYRFPLSFSETFNSSSFSNHRPKVVQIKGSPSKNNECIQPKASLRRLAFFQKPHPSISASSLPYLVLFFTKVSPHLPLWKFNRFLWKNILYFFYESVSQCMFVYYMGMGVHRGEEWVSQPLEIGCKAVDSHQMWVLGTILRSFTRAASVFNLWALSPD